MTATGWPGRRAGPGAAGVGAAACAACCVGPVVGFLAAAGVASVLAAAVLGVVGLVVVGATVTVWQRRRRPRRCVPGADPVPVDAPGLGPKMSR